MLAALKKIANAWDRFAGTPSPIAYLQSINAACSAIASEVTRAHYLRPIFTRSSGSVHCIDSKKCSSAAAGLSF